MTPVHLGMSLAEARAALETAGVAFVERGESQRVLSFTIAGTRSIVTFDGEAIQIITSFELPTFEGALAVVVDQVARRGPPSSMSHGHGADLEHVSQHWRWPTFRLWLSSSRMSGWHLELTDSARSLQQPPTPDTMSTDEVRALARDTLARASTTPPGAGERAAAVAACRGSLDQRLRSLGDVAKLIDTVAPGTPVDSRPARDLATHVGWLARHDELFPHPDDHRAALVVTKETLVTNLPQDLGWRMDVAWQLDRSFVQFADGPFAYGVYRVVQTAEEVYPDPGWLTGVEITQLPTAAMGIRVRASIGDGVAELEGYAPSVVRVARRLALARARSR